MTALPNFTATSANLPFSPATSSFTPQAHAPQLPMHLRFANCLALLRDPDAFLRRLNNLWKHISGQAIIPSLFSATQATLICTQYLKGKGSVYSFYAKNILSAYLWAEGKTHRRTGAKLLDDLAQGKRIYLSNYS